MTDHELAVLQLDILIMELEAEEQKAYDDLIAAGYDPTYLDGIKRQMEEDSLTPLTPEEREEYARIYRAIVGASMN